MAEVRSLRDSRNIPGSPERVQGFVNKFLADRSGDIDVGRHWLVGTYRQGNDIIVAEIRGRDRADIMSEWQSLTGNKPGSVIVRSA